MKATVRKLKRSLDQNKLSCWQGRSQGAPKPEGGRGGRSWKKRPWLRTFNRVLILARVSSLPRDQFRPPLSANERMRKRNKEGLYGERKRQKERRQWICIKVGAHDGFFAHDAFPRCHVFPAGDHAAVVRFLLHRRRLPAVYVTTEKRNRAETTIRARLISFPPPSPSPLLFHAVAAPSRSGISIMSTSMRQKLTSSDRK